MVDLLLLVHWDVIILDQEEGIGTINTFCAGLGTGSDALTKSAKFICVRFIPRFFIPGITAELAMFKELAHCRIKHRVCVGAVYLVQGFTEISKPPISLGVMASD